jgi:hypothetical protein
MPSMPFMLYQTENKHIKDGSVAPKTMPLRCRQGAVILTVCADRGSSHGRSCA